MTRNPIYLTWLNAHGNFEYFYFTADNAYQVEVGDSGISRKNILPLWPKSYGRTADTITRQTFRTTRNTIVLRSQHLNANQLEVLSGIRSSVLVQIVYSRTNRRTVIVDTNSFKKYDEQEQALFSLQFTISYTDEIPSQRV
jgi:hypothetical protein